MGYIVKVYDKKGKLFTRNIRVNRIGANFDKRFWKKHGYTTKISMQKKREYNPFSFKF